MTQLFTLVSVLSLAGWAWWIYREATSDVECVRVRVRLDHGAPGAHLIWDVTNAASRPVILTKLIVHGRHGANDTFPAGLPWTLGAHDSVLIPTDVDWALLSAKSIAVADDEGHEHAVKRAELTTVQDHLRHLIDRRVDDASARDWLFGAADLAFGAVILGLGFFMLMWVIATG